MRTTVNVGDCYDVGGYPMVVAEVRQSTDQRGVVNFEVAPVTAELYRVSDVPLVVSYDQVFACYLLRGKENADLYAVGVYHPTLGERIAPAPPRPAPFTQRIVLCWAPGQVQVLINGTPAANETVSLMLERRTKDGTTLCLLPDRYKVLRWSEEWQALVDSGERDGPYKTDADGYVYNAALGEALMFPCGDGAFGQRYLDRLCDGAPLAEEYTDRVWLYFRGQRVELREGEAASLNWRTGTIVVSGPAGWWVRAELEHVGNDPTSVTCRLARQIPSAGQVTLEGLYPGRYCISAWKPGGGVDARDWSVIARRQWVSVGAGETAYATVTAETPPDGYYLVYAYISGAEATAGIEIYGLVLPSGYQVVGTTNATGRALIPADPPPANMLINDNYWGYQQLRGDGPTFEATLAGHMVIAVSLGFGGEAGWWAFPGTGHEHLDAYAPDWRVKVVQTGEIIGCTAIPIGARTSVPVPHLPPGTIDGWTFTPPAATYDITLVAADGSYVSTLQEAGEVIRDGTDASKLVLEVLGGKAWGNLLGHDPGQATEPGLPEAARIGLEHGRWLPAMVQRYLREGQMAVEGRTGWICPYCLCMTHIWPGPDYGYCPQCGADARTYLHGPPMTEGRWDVRTIALGPNRRRVEVLCQKWYRPLLYAENDDYLVRYHDLPRWVCQHAVLGEWDSGAWSEGVGAEELEEEWCAPDERLLLRPKLQIVGQIAGDALYRLRYRSNLGELRHLDFELAEGDEGIKLLSNLAPVWAEVRDAADVLFVRRVTSVSLLEPENDPGNRFRIVADVPSLILAALRVRKAQASHLALQMCPLVTASGPDLRLTPDGRLYVAYVSGGDVWVAQRPSPQKPWSVPVRVTEGGHYGDPSITILPTGVIVLAYTDLGDDSQRIAVSFDDGATWEVQP